MCNVTHFFVPDFFCLPRHAKSGDDYESVKFVIEEHGGKREGAGKPSHDKGIKLGGIEKEGKGGSEKAKR